MEVLSPWQSLPDFLAQRLVQAAIEEELRVLCVAALRLVSRGWREAVDDALPVLAPRPLVTAAEAAAVAARFPGLLVLRMQCLIPVGQPDLVELASDRVAALVAICSGCSSLRSLCLLGWDHLTEAALEPLPALSQLHTLKLESERLSLGAAGFSALRQLPRLRSLELRCYRVDVSELATMGHLTSLNLAVERAGMELAPALARLTGLRHLGISRLRKGWGGLTQLTALTSLTSVSLHRPPHLGLQPLDVLLALLSGGSSGGGDGGGSSTPNSLRRVDVAAWAADAAPSLEMAALSRLECLHLEYRGPQFVTAAQVTCLAGLTELQLDVRQLAGEHEDSSEGEISAFVAAVGRRLTALRHLSLRHIDHASDPALECLSGLTRLTDLSLHRAHEFGERALSALLPLTDLRRLSVSHAPLNASDVEAVLAPADEDPRLRLPHLTYLFISQCQLLSGHGLTRLAAALPSLRWLVHRGELQLHRQHLLHTLRACHSLRLLQTSWRPAEPPLGCATGAASSLTMAAERGDVQQQQRPQLLRCLEDRAFCKAWRLRLQPGQPTGGIQMHHQGREALVAYYAFDAPLVLREVLEQQL